MQSTGGAMQGILKAGQVRQGSFYASAGPGGGPTVWDRLAGVDPVHAAVSAADEAAEAQKSAAVVELLARELPDGVVADLGCGYGRIAKYLLPRRSFAGYVGVDGSATMLTLFDRRYRERPAEQRTPLLLLKSGIDRLPVEDASLDAVFSCAVLLHNPKTGTRAAVAEIFRVLKPGGKVVIVDSFPSRSSLQGLFGSAYQLAYALRGRGESNGPVRYFTRGEVERMFSAFGDVRVAPAGLVTIPKSYPFLGARLNAAYRRAVYAPVDRGLRRILPEGAARVSPQFYNVVARK
ncbi:MAG: class I SAM-dependent methyltransferase [Longimicrobiaceae bacterium]